MMKNETALFEMGCEEYCEETYYEESFAIKLLKQNR